MSEIFKGASRVDCWLGDGLDGSEDGLKYVTAARLQIIPTVEWDAAQGKQLKTPPKMTYDEFEEQHADQLPTVKVLCHNTYFTRVWIAQEFQIARNLLVVCGSTAVAGDIVCGFHFTYSRGQEETRALFGPAERHLTHKLMKKQYYDTVWDLSRILNRFADRDCTDPKDKVFGLRGIIKQGHPITVD